MRPNFKRISHSAHSAVVRLRLVGNKTQMVFRLHPYLYNCGFIASAYSMG